MLAHPSLSSHLFFPLLRPISARLSAFTCCHYLPNQCRTTSLSIPKHLTPAKGKEKGKGGKNERGRGPNVPRGLIGKSLQTKEGKRELCAFCLHTLLTEPPDLRMYAYHQDCIMHVPEGSYHKPALPKKSHHCQAFTSLMGGERSQHWTSQSTCRAPRRHQHTAVEQQRIPPRGTEPTRSSEEEARDILATAAKNQPEDGPGTRRAAIRACKYLRAMVSQHGPQLQAVYDAAKVHTQRSKGSATNETTPYRPKESELPVVAPELTSELLHCLSTLPDPWPFFPSNAFMALARSFYMFECISQKD